MFADKLSSLGLSNFGLFLISDSGTGEQVMNTFINKQET